MNHSDIVYKPVFWRASLGDVFVPIPESAKHPERTPEVGAILYADGTIWDKIRGETYTAPNELLARLQAIHKVFWDSDSYNEYLIKKSPATSEDIINNMLAKEPPYNPTILEEANDIIYGDREKTYGHPAKNIKAIAAQWTLYLEQKYGHLVSNAAFIQLTAEDVCYMMADLKKCRQMNHAKRDNLVDGAGYLALIDRIHEGDNNEQD